MELEVLRPHRKFSLFLFLQMFRLRQWIRSDFAFGLFINRKKNEKEEEEKKRESITVKPYSTFHNERIDLTELVESGVIRFFKIS